jgi:class 3 adenylate cyclase
VQSQLELKRANDEIRSLARHLEIRNSFIRRLFGRYVSDQVVDTLLEEPDAIGLSGEIRRVTILVADLRGFSSITADREPVDVLAVLNNYLGTLFGDIRKHYSSPREATEPSGVTR